MYYRPRLASGQEAPLTWEIKCSFFNGTWPINDSVTALQRNVDRLKVLSCGLTFIAIFGSQAYEIVLQKDYILIMVKLVLNLMITLECMIRIGCLAFNKHTFKEYLSVFYSRIYIDVNTHKDMHHQICYQTRPANIYSFWYVLTLLSFQVGSIHSFIVGNRYLPYIMTIPFNYQPWPIYFAILIMCFLAGVFVLTVVISESYLLATSILNLNGRFMLLEEDVLKLGDDVLKIGSPETVADQFNERLIQLVKQNVDLIRFAGILESQFTVPLFLMMADSAVMLCLLAFNTHEMGFTPESIRYITWLVGKVLELVVLGYLGSIISTRVAGLGTTYYASGWEKVIHKSHNAEANVRTMKLIARVISFNQTPLKLSGMGFFDVSLETTTAVLRVAGSYFTFLCSMR